MNTNTFYPGDMILEQIGNQVIVENRERTIEVIHLERGTRFIIDLDDSKISGNRHSLGMTYDEQVHAAKRYIELYNDLK